MDPIRRNNRHETYVSGQNPRNSAGYHQSRRPNARTAGQERSRPRRRRGLSGKALAALLLLPLAAAVVMITLFSGTAAPNHVEGIRRMRNTAEAGNDPAELPLDYPIGENNGADIIYAGDDTPAGSIPLTPVTVNDITDTGYLALVNYQHPIQNKPYMLSGAWPTVAVSRIDDMYLHDSALRAVSEMFSSARQEEIASFFVSSGFRSYDAQTILYGDGSNSDFVQPPGHSEHHTGLAADILAPGVGMMEMAYSPEGEWLAANSYRYGLILRYPEWATHITGIAFEPWHFRYVGRLHAYFITRNNLVLEEYIAKIIDYGHISFEKNGQTYHVMHQAPQDGTISVPYDMEFLASSDNKGGFIIMAW